MHSHPLIPIIQNRDLLKGLAQSFGTPLYIYSQQRLVDNISKLDKALKTHFLKYHICYAIKANSNPHLIRVLRDALPSLGGDCSSPGEIHAAEKSGIKPDDCIYTGNYESAEELSLALEKGCHLNLDDGNSFDRLKQLAIPKEISFRLNPGYGKGTFSQITTAGENAKFGIPKENILEAYRTAKDAGVKRFGIQCMAGSGVLNEAYFPELLKAILNTAREVENALNITMSFISLGGGYGIPYRDEDRPLDVDAVFKNLSAVFYSFYNRVDAESPALWIEPGKIIVGDAGILLAKVTGTKDSYKNYIGLGAGMETLMRPALYGAQHRIYKVGAVDAPARSTVDFTGPICENTDRVAVDRPFPEVQEGDLIAVLDAGAYGYSMSHNFNTRPRAAEILLDGSESKLIRRRETIEDLFKLCDV